MEEMNNNYSRIDFAKLESKVESMSDKLNKLNEIESTLNQIQQSLSINHTDTALLSKDVEYIREKHKLLNTRVIENEKKLDTITIKVTSIVSVVSFIAWVISNTVIK